MQVKKAGGKVYGAVLTAAEKKAMDLEIQRELAEYDRKPFRRGAQQPLCRQHQVPGAGGR